MNYELLIMDVHQISQVNFMQDWSFPRLPPSPLLFRLPTTRRLKTNS